MILSERSIRDSFPTGFTIPRLELYDTVTSTNIIAHELALNGCPEGTTVIADTQTAGRGRLGRTFYSPQSCGIYMSIVLRPDIPLSEASDITTCAAASTAVSIEQISGKKVSIKWVNDIFLNFRKVCGILTESVLSGTRETPEFCILGIGINVTQPDGNFPEELSNIAASIFSRSEYSPELHNKLASDVISRFFSYYGDINHKSYMQEYRSRSMLIGRRVVFDYHGERVEALVKGIDDSAHLLVQKNDGSSLALSSGEVSVRPL